MARTKGTLKFAFLPVLPSLLFFLAMPGAPGAGSDPGRHVEPGKARELILENKGNPGFSILDVRTPGEFAEGHLEGAVLVDYRSPRFRQEMAQLDREKTYLVYCRTGNRSAHALETMKDLGFRSIYHLEGGIKRWVEEGLPAVR
jgi:rhodanese-related sulfurtransferase